MQAETQEVSSQETPKTIERSQEFKEYWYGGQAEITSYELQQARYGEMRQGKAVLIFVTEDFLPEKQVKADQQNDANISVLKLNATKNFITGIYPYSVMESTFYPVEQEQHAIKVSTSVQEWCGQVYAQVNNKPSGFEVLSHSYFEKEADENFSLPKHILENELWTQIRTDPSSLPQGKLQIIPSLAYCRLKHKDIKAYPAEAVLEKVGNTTKYSIQYPDLNRNLQITFQTDFPHEIMEWSEQFQSGFGSNATLLTTRATKIKTIQSSYWNKNRKSDTGLREELGL